MVVDGVGLVSLWSLVVAGVSVISVGFGIGPRTLFGLFRPGLVNFL